MKRAILILSVIFLVNTGNISLVNAGCSDTLNIKDRKNFLRSFVTDKRDMIISPFHWDAKDLITAGSLTLATGLIMTQDKNIMKFAQSHRTNFTDKFSTYGLEPFGTGLLYENYSLISIALFYSGGLVFHDKKAEETALLGLKAYTAASLLVYIPKLLAGRHRPFQSYRNNEPDPYWFTVPGYKYVSFVSGHAAATFALATVIANEYHGNIAVPVASYLVATLVGLSRINDNKHWASDVFAGGALGIVTGRFFCKKYVRLHVEPGITCNQPGLRLAYSLN